MTGWAFWTWVAVAVLLIVPPIVFALFLREAARMFREFGNEGEE